MYEDSTASGHVQHRRFEFPEDAVDARIDRLAENEDPMPLVLETLSRVDLTEKLPLLKRLFEEKGANIHYRDDDILGQGGTLLLFAIGYLNDVGDRDDDDAPSCLEYLLQRGADRTNFDVEYARQMGKEWAVEILERPVFRQYHQT